MKTYTCVFIAVLLILARRGNNPNEQENVAYPHNEYYSTTKRNEVLVRAMT